MTPAIFAANAKLLEVKEALRVANNEMVTAYTPTINSLVEKRDWTAFKHLIDDMPECGYRMRMAGYLESLTNPTKPL